jgi:hypothetical protein
MAKETKAQREARLELVEQGRLAMAKATYTERLMAVLERAVKENFELEVRSGLFVVEDRDNRYNVRHGLKPTWTETADMDLYSLEVEVELKEEASAELVRKAQVRGKALAKLTEEEKELLGL